MPTALVTGSPDRVPDIANALKTAGFDILARPMSADGALDFEANAADCYLRLPADTQALRTVVGLLAEAILEDHGPAGRRTTEPLPWRDYASAEPDLGFADWRSQVLCLASVPDA